MTPLWTEIEADAATKGRSSHAWQAFGVSIDTRTLQQGDLFVALKAARDGHDFVAQAAKLGAAAAVVTHRPADVPPDFPVLIVDDVLQGLIDLGVAARARTQARVIGVTGSVGKTSTKEMLKAVLEQQGKTHASVASYNNHWGVPLTLARMPQDTAYAIIEMGMNHPGEIAPLSKMARPHVGLVTKIAAAHIEAFDDIFGIALEKASIVDGLEPNGVAVFNANTETFSTMQRYADRVTLQAYGDEQSNRIVQINVRDGKLYVTALIAEQTVSFSLQTVGQHFALNAVGALVALHAGGADLGQGARDMVRWHPVKGRGQTHQIKFAGQDAVLIDDSYNANPASMEASLNVLSQTPAQRRLAILGDMKELGETSKEAHRAISDLPAMADISAVVTVGQDIKALHSALGTKAIAHFDTAQACCERLSGLIEQGDCILVKASLSTGLGAVVEALLASDYEKSD